MTSNFDEQLSSQLDALGADVSNVHMAGPTAARRRAAQRTRNQVTGGVLAGVAIVALGFAGAMQDDLFTAPEPAHPTDTETPTTVPSPPDDPDDTENPDDPQPPDDPNIDNMLISLGEMGDVDPEIDAPVAWGLSDATASPFTCAPAVPDGASYASYESDQNGHFLQFIEHTDDPVTRYSELRADIESCVNALAENGDASAFSQVWALDGLGDEAWMANYWSPMDQPIDSFEANLVSARMMRSGSYVSVIILGGPGLDDNANMDVDDSVTAAQHFCAELGGECPDEPETRRLDREPVGDVPGWLTVEDIVEVTGYEEITEGSEVRADDDGPGGWPLAQLPRDPMSDGATSLQGRTYGGDDPTTSDVMLEQTAATFPDETTARAHYDELVAAADEFEQEGDEVTNTGSVDDDGYSLTTWRSENAEYDTTFVYGVVVQGSTVSVVSTGFSDHEDRDLTPEQLTQLLTRAAERLAAA